MIEANNVESTTKPSFSKYPEHFQVNLVKLIIEDRAFASQMQEVLELSYFENDYLKIIVDNIFKYKDKYGVHPAHETIDMIFSTQLKDVEPIKKNQINSFWDSFKRNKKVEDPEYYMKIALDFCRSQKVLEALKKSFDLLKDANIDEFMENMAKSAALGSSQNFGHDYLEDFEKRYEKDHREPITTGWPELDSVTKGGIGAGEVFVYVAPQSMGKSSRLVYTSCKNLEQGRNVVYFTLEMPEIEIGQKFDACLTEIHLEKLVENKEAIRKKLEELPGKLRIIEEEYCSSTPRRIYNKVKKLEDNGFQVDLVVIDYADVCAPTKTLKDDDGMVGGVQVYTEMKTLTQRYNKRTLTAAQTNREGAEAEIITPKHFEGMFKRFNPCHFVVGFSKYGKVKELKTRVGPPFVFGEEKDLGRVRTRLYSLEEDMDNIAAQITKSKTNKSVQHALEEFLKKK
jgi:hypothetical protein